MSVHSINDDNDYDRVARTGVSLVIAVMVIASLPLILGMVVLLPGWLEQSGLLISQHISF